MDEGYQVEAILGGRAVVASIDGRVPSDVVGEANERVISLLGRDCLYLILDCSRMTELGSKGLGLAAYHAATLKRRGGELLIVSPPTEILRRVGGEVLRGIARFTSSMEEALDYVGEALSAAVDSE